MRTAKVVKCIASQAVVLVVRLNRVITPSEDQFPLESRAKHTYSVSSSGGMVGNNRVIYNSIISITKKFNKKL